MPNLAKILTVEAEITSDGQLIVPKRLIKDLFSKGYKKVKIEILAENADFEIFENIDINLAEKIKEVQGIPINTVLDFMKSKGNLKKLSIRNDF